MRDSCLFRTHEDSLFHKASNATQLVKQEFLHTELEQDEGLFTEGLTAALLRVGSTIIEAAEEEPVLTTTCG